MGTVLTGTGIESSTEDMAHDKFLQMRASTELRAMIDHLRKQEPDLPSRSEMIRRLVVKAFDAAKKKERKNG